MKNELITITLDHEAAIAICDLLQRESMNAKFNTSALIIPNKKEAVDRAFEIVAKVCIESFINNQIRR